MLRLIQAHESLDYSDVFIVPQYSEIDTRTQVDVGIELALNLFKTEPLKLKVPVISANMDTITGSHMAKTMYGAGAFGALHRFMTIEENIKEYKLVQGHRIPTDCFVSVGVNRDSKERAQALYNEGARYFVIDIAHGHSKMMKTMMEWMKANLPDIFLMAGNVATEDGAADLGRWGADAIKVGIGPGSVCLTKDVTGVTVPQFTAIHECSKILDWNWGGRRLHIVADGGIKSIGDIAKALGAGASMVMVGGMLAGCDECPGEVIGGSKVYRGMASRDAMRFIRVEGQMPTPEGKTTFVPLKGSVEPIIQDIQGGLQSAFSYVNAKNLKEFQKKVHFGIRRTVR